MHTAGYTHVNTHKAPFLLMHTPTCARPDAEVMVSLIKTLLIGVCIIQFVTCGGKKTQEQ